MERLAHGVPHTPIARRILSRAKHAPHPDPGPQLIISRDPVSVGRPYPPTTTHHPLSALAPSARTRRPNLAFSRKRDVAKSGVKSKDEIVRRVQALPEKASLDDVIERLILIRKVNVGLAQEGQGLPQSAAEAELRKARRERLWNRG